MTAYVSKPPFASSGRHPKALLLIVGGHAALLAVAMSAKMDLPAKIIPTITKVTLIDPPKPPPPDQPMPPKQPSPPLDSAVDRPPPIIPVPPLNGPAVDPTPVPVPDPGDTVIGNAIVPTPDPLPLPVPNPVHTGPRFATPAELVKPPYPPSKLRTDEEAVLRLRLSIDQRGRVTAVEPVGSADRAFLDAARRHIIAKWRYTPATEDGRAVASSTVITLAFRIEG